MSAKERRKQFKAAIKAISLPDARLAENFGFSNSARIIEGGLFTCTNNLEAFSAKASGGIAADLTQLVLLCVLTFPPSDEIYFAITVCSDIKRLTGGLIKLFRDVDSRNQRLIAKGKRPGRANNNVKFFLTKGGRLYFSNEFVEELRPTNLDPSQFVDVDTVRFSIWPPSDTASHSVFAREFVGYIGSLVGRSKVHEFRVWKDT